MMMPKLDGLVADEVLGALDPARSLFVASLASMKPEISQEIARYEAVGGALLATARPVALRTGSFERLAAAIERTPAPEPPSPADPGLTALPEPLRAVAATALRKGAWRRLLPGVRALDLGPALPGAPFPGRGVIAELLRIYPGWSIPRHSHGGEELTLVLAGGFTDETGHFGVGDVAIVDPALTHHPVADPGEPCLSYIVSDVQPRFTGPLGLLSRGLDFLQGKR